MIPNTNAALQLTREISAALNRIQAEDHVVHKGLRDVLFDSVGPVFDQDVDFFPLRPSSALKPMRDLYYDLTNFYSPGSIPKSDFEPRIKLIFQFGHLTETLLKKLAAHKFDVQFEQQRVKYGELKAKDGTIIPLTGSIDWAMRLDGTSELISLCDAKSIGEYPFKTAPKPENIAQMQLYMHSDWGRANKVNKAILIYFNKNNSDIKCIEIDYDAGLAQKLLNRLYLVWDYFQRGELPPREYVAGCDWQANYSSYRDYDNREFCVPEDQRTTERVQEVYGVSKYLKDDIRAHHDRFGNKVVYYLNKKTMLVYRDETLTLVVEPI